MPIEQPESVCLEQTAHWLKHAKRVLIITGAGMSAESGLPTYRGMGGLYSSLDTEEGLPIEKLLSGQMMREKPATCWKYIAQIETACRGAVPHAGYFALAKLEQIIDSVVILTQNVDGLHIQAGSKNVIEIHGNLYRIHCTQCTWRDDVEDYSHFTALPPHCVKCGSPLRPQVVLFEEMLPPDAVNQYQAAINRGFDLVMSIGTTSVFPYIAEPVIRARHHGAHTIEINPGDTEVSHLVDLQVRRPASGFLSDLVRLMQGEGQG